MIIKSDSALLIHSGLSGKFTIAAYRAGLPLRNLTISILFLLLLSLESKAANLSAVDTIDVKLVSVEHIASGKRMTLMDPHSNYAFDTEEPIQIFAMPLVDRKPATITLFYRGIRLLVSKNDGRIRDMAITEDNYRLNVNGTVLWVGQSIESLQPLFPRSFDVLNGDKLAITLKSKGRSVAGWLYITLDKGKIKMIQVSGLRP